MASAAVFTVVKEMVANFSWAAVVAAKIVRKSEIGSTVMDVSKRLVKGAAHSLTSVVMPVTKVSVLGDFLGVGRRC
jgi:hypothetical protein